MLKIGEFARVGGMTTATLRYYDLCGLLKPLSTSQENNYRYYTLAQLSRLNRILTFKDFGFSLEQTTQLLHEDVPLEQLHCSSPSRNCRGLIYYALVPIVRGDEGVIN